MSQNTSIDRRTLLRYLAAGSAVAGLGGISGLGQHAGAARRAASATPVRGGTATFGIPGAELSGEIEPHYASSNALRAWALNGYFESLLKPDYDFNFMNVLAEEVVPDDAIGSSWTIRVKDGIEFHNGKTLDADDVAFSLQRMSDPRAFASGEIGNITDYKKRDARTLTVTLGQPRGWFDISVGDGGSKGIVPVDYDPANPVSTGPFKLVSVDGTTSATLERFENYHDGEAYLDSIVVVAMSDPAARLNALLSGAIDVLVDMAPTGVRQLEGNDAFVVYNSPSGRSWPIQMRTDTGPLADVRLRQALRLVLDREQLVQSVYGGLATVGNDLYGTYDPAYTADLQRVRDVDEAKRLVAEIGGGDINLELNTIESQKATCLFLAENAKEIGVNIDVKVIDLATLYGDNYLEWEFYTGDLYPTYHFISCSSMVDAPEPSIGNPHFHDDEYFGLWNQLSASTDPAEQTELVNAMQQILFDRGGWIIGAFQNSLGAYSSRLTGFPDHDVYGATLGRLLHRVGFVD